MSGVLIKASGFLLVILLGYLLKKIHFFSSVDHKLISKIVMNITLPAAVITAFSNFRKDGSLFALVGVGLAANLLMVGIGYLLSKRRDAKSKALYMLNLPGYNIGTFTMPFIQGFLGPFGVIATCMFDTGNAIMCTGGSYALTSGVVNGDKRIDLKELVSKLIRSVPFDSYMLMLIISTIGMKIPSEITTITSTIASANGFLAMLMIGLMIEIKMDSKHLKDIVTVLSTRYIVAGLLSASFYFLSPFSFEIRQVLAIIVFAPITALAPFFTEKCHGDSSLSSLTSSISIIISIAIMTTLLVAMGIKI